MFRTCKLILTLMLVQIICAPNAFAISKLSSFTRTAQPYVVAAKDYLSAAQEIVNEVSTEYLRMKSMIESGELADKLKGYAMDKGKDYAKAEYEKQSAKYKEKRKKKKELKKKEKERAAAAAEVEDYKESVKDAKLNKKEQMDERLAELYAKHKSSGLSKEESEKIAEEIKSLEAQKQSNMDKPLESDPMLKNLNEKKDKLDKEVADTKKETSEADTEEELFEKTKGLFDETKEQNEENKAIYQVEIEALFLKENEESTSENLARIKKNRGREFYNAVQNAMRVAVVEANNSSTIEEKLKEYKDNSSEVDANLAVKNINIAVAIENAKAAALLTEAMLAEMRLKTMKDMQGWNNKNKLYDYKKPITEFEFDSYELKKSDLKDKAKAFYESHKDEIKDKAKDYYDNHKDDIKNMWHKI